MTFDGNRTRTFRHHITQYLCWVRVRLPTGGWTVLGHKNKGIETLVFIDLSLTGVGRMHKNAELRGSDSNRQPTGYTYPNISTRSGLYHHPRKKDVRRFGRPK